MFFSPWKSTLDNVRTSWLRSTRRYNICHGSLSASITKPLESKAYRTNIIFILLPGGWVWENKKRLSLIYFQFSSPSLNSQAQSLTRLTRFPSLENSVPTYVMQLRKSKILYTVSVTGWIWGYIILYFCQFIKCTQDEPNLLYNPDTGFPSFYKIPLSNVN